MKKYILSALLLGVSINGAASIVTVKPPALDDRFYMIRYTDGTSELRKNLTSTQVLWLELQPDIKKVIQVSYADLVVAASQRVYDYHYYFEQYIATCDATQPGVTCSPSNPSAWTAALDRLMTVFSDNLTSFTAICNGPFTATSKSEVRSTYTTLYDIYFRGYTLHIAPNLRVIPICNNRHYQLYVSTGQLDFSRINVNADPANLNVVTDIGYYAFTLNYESDNVWRFITWEVDNRVQYIDPPLNYGPQTSNCIYKPYPEDPAIHC